MQTLSSPNIFKNKIVQHWKLETSGSRIWKGVCHHRPTSRVAWVVMLSGRPSILLIPRLRVFRVQRELTTARSWGWTINHIGDRILALSHWLFSCMFGVPELSHFRIIRTPSRKRVDIHSFPRPMSSLIFSSGCWLYLTAKLSGL